MRKLIVAGLLAGAGLVGLTGSSRAEFFLRVPFVTVRIDRGSGVFVGAGPAVVQVPGRPGVMAPAPAPAPADIKEPVPADPGDPALPPPRTLPSATVVKPMTVEQFVEVFQPKAGRYEVLLVHPKSGQPIKVCFDLPPGAPRKVRWTRHVLEFDYGRDSVRIRFYHNGEVGVLN